MSALQMIFIPVKRSSWRWRAARTRSRMTADDAPSLSPWTVRRPPVPAVLAQAGQAGEFFIVHPGHFDVDVDPPQTGDNVRSSSGPEMRFWYIPPNPLYHPDALTGRGSVTVEWARVQGFWLSP
jgi:hypothetical protein